jgi:hypothetical protein
MIINKSVLLTISNKNMKHLQSKGYTNLVINNKIEIPVEDLQKGSNVIVDVKCNNCGKINKIKYIKYNTLQNGYYCKNKECINKARSISVMNKYGVDNVSKVKEIIDKKVIIITDEMKEKQKKTCLEKYGVDNAMKCDAIKEKTKQTLINKYGVSNLMESEHFRNKIKQTNLEKYGVEYTLQNKEVMCKVIKTNLEKYGTINVFQNEEIKDKIKDKLIENYGVDNPMKLQETKIKIAKTNLEKYGVEDCMKLIFFKNKMKLTRIANGNQVPDELLSEFYIYRRKVDNLTKINCVSLYEKWDGFDYYDGEYIKNNDINDRKNYPSVDHKISVYYGFINNIPEEEIASLNNLCITKISINSKKRNLTEEQFKNKNK